MSNLGCAPKPTRVIPARFHLIAVTGDGPALAKLSCTSFATHGANCRCCLGTKASKFVYGEGEAPSAKRDDVEHVRLLRALNAMYELRLQFRVEMADDEHQRRFRNANAEEANLKRSATRMGVSKRGSKMRLSELFHEQRTRQLNQFYDSLPCDIVHVFEAGVFKKVLEVVLEFIPRFAEVKSLKC